MTIPLQRLRLGKDMTAYMAKPDGAGRCPGVVLLHERYGIDQHTLDLTAKLGDAGYVALAPDLFWRFDGDREALRRGDARVELRDDECLEDLDQALAYLRSRSDVYADRLVIIGVCQSGRQPLLMASQRDALAAAVVFYGGVGPREWEPNELRPYPVAELIEGVHCPVLGVFGEDDHVIPVDDVVRFRNHLEKAKRSYQIRIYRDAPHGWLNDTMPGRYRREAAEDAWRLLVGFINQACDGGWDPQRVVWRFESDFAVDYDPATKRRLA